MDQALEGEVLHDGCQAFHPADEAQKGEWEHGKSVS
jgi:hypothetical protein